MFVALNALKAIYGQNLALFYMSCLLYMKRTWNFPTYILGHARVSLSKFLHSNTWREIIRGRFLKQKKVVALPRQIIKARVHEELG